MCPLTRGPIWYRFFEPQPIVDCSFLREPKQVQKGSGDNSPREYPWFDFAD